MYLRTLLIVAGLGVAMLAPAATRPQSTNVNVKRAMKSAKKIRPGKARKYKAPKKSKKPARATFGGR